MNITDTALDERKFSEFNPFGMGFRQNPENFHIGMFEESPGFIEMEGVSSAYVATYAQCVAVLRDFKRFSSLKPQGLPGMQRVDFFNSLPVMNYSDPPDHTRRRKVVNPAFTPRRVEVLLEAASQLTDRLIDSAIASGRFDVMTAIARPLAVETLLGRFMGMPQEDWHVFLDFVQTLPLLDALRENDPKPAAYVEAWEAGTRFCRQQQELARQGKCDNLIGVIANGADGGAISDDEMMAMMIVLLTGGFGTVGGVIGAALKNLAANPGLAAELAADPSLAEKHLEESLRLDPPVSLVMRFAKEAVELGGRIIPAGTPVYVMIASACHDPAAFADPYRFDLHRANAKDHLAFGQGIHTCIGNAITRSLVPMVIRKFAERVPGLRLADGHGHIEWEVGTPRARHLRQVILDAG